MFTARNLCRYKYEEGSLLQIQEILYHTGFEMINPSLNNRRLTQSANVFVSQKIQQLFITRIVNEQVAFISSNKC